MAGALALALTACGDGITPAAPPVLITYSLKPGEEVACTETLVRIGLPFFTAQVIGFGRRTFTCRLRFVAN